MRSASVPAPCLPKGTHPPERPAAIAKAKIWAGGLCLAASALLAWPAQATSVAGSSPPAAAAPWWSPFNDPALARLAARADEGAAGEMAVVHSYLALRTAQARLGVAQRVQQATDEVRELLLKAEPAPGSATEQRDRWLNTLAAHAERWRALQQELLAQRERAEVTLAALCHVELAQVKAQTAQAEGELPDVALPVPFSLPNSAHSEQARSVLPSLQAAAARRQQAQLLLQASELQLRAHQLRQQAGTEDALAAVESLMRALADADQLALSQGNLAVAWAQLLQQGTPSLATALAKQVSP